MKHLLPVLALGILGLLVVAVDVRAQNANAEMEEFLRTADVVKTQFLSDGVTGSMRATLTKDGETHEAQIQIVDIFKPESQIDGRTIRNFRDSYRYNIAAYELSKLMALDLVPVTVARTYKGDKAAFALWVDPVMMTEAKRMADNVMPPDADSWNYQINRVRVFTQLIYDTDPNLGNIVITPQWRVWRTWPMPSGQTV